MPTKKPTIGFVIEPENLKNVENYQYENRISSKSKALNDIILRGLKELERIKNNQYTSPPFNRK